MTSQAALDAAFGKRGAAGLTESDTVTFELAAHLASLASLASGSSYS
jgi:hypothetical protein